MIFNGKFRCSFTCTERYSQDGLKVTFFDENWNVLPFERKYPKSTRRIKKPDNYKKMIKISEAIAADWPFARIDYFELSGKMFFGETTFYPGSGMEDFRPLSWDYKLGNLLKLPYEK